MNIYSNALQSLSKKDMKCTSTILAACMTLAREKNDDEEIKFIERFANFIAFPSSDPTFIDELESRLLEKLWKIPSKKTGVINAIQSIKERVQTESDPFGIQEFGTPDSEQERPPRTSDGVQGTRRNDLGSSQVGVDNDSRQTIPREDIPGSADLLEPGERGEVSNNVDLGDVSGNGMPKDVLHGDGDTRDESDQGETDTGIDYENIPF